MQRVLRLHQGQNQITSTVTRTLSRVNQTQPWSHGSLRVPCLRSSLPSQDKWRVSTRRMGLSTSRMRGSIALRFSPAWPLDVNLPCPDWDLGSCRTRSSAASLTVRKKHRQRDTRTGMASHSYRDRFRGQRLLIAAVALAHSAHSARELSDDDRSGPLTSSHAVTHR